MMIPRFSIKRLLLITTASALFFWLATWAFGGGDWAIVPVIAGVAVLVALGVHATIFAILSLFNRFGLGPPELRTWPEPAVGEASPISTSPSSTSAPG